MRMARPPTARSRTRSPVVRTRHCLRLMPAPARSLASTPAYEIDADVPTMQVTASDGMHTSVQDITINLTDANDNTPAITSLATFTVAENTTAVGSVVATDADGTAANNTVTYS